MFSAAIMGDDSKGSDVAGASSTKEDRPSIMTILSLLPLKNWMDPIMPLGHVVHSL